MSRYNLIDEKWIPVRFLDGTRDAMGINETLLKSKDIAAIEDPSPLIVAALHRFLLAVLYRALEGPNDKVQAKALFNDGLPSAKIEAYLEKWRDRFYLFDEKYPFYQIHGYEPKTYRTWSALAAEHNADNAKVLFDHTDVTASGSISEAVACRLIVAAQTFAVSSGKSELSHTGTAPSATAVMALPLGHNLEATLIFSLVPQNIAVSQSDYPIWERTPETVDELRAGIKRMPSGLADRYTWRTRAIRIVGDTTGHIEKLALASGVSSSSEEQIDPMLAYRIDEERGKLPIQFRDRGLWRDFDSLLPDETRLAPSVIEHAAYLTRADINAFPRSVLVLGQSNNKAKIEFWRMERFTLPEALIGDGYIRTGIKKLLDEANEAQKSLWSASSSFARDVLSRGDRVPHKEDVKKYIQQMAVDTHYWSLLEARFHEVLERYTIDANPDDIECMWLEYVRDSIKTSWNQYRKSVSDGSSWVIRALVKAAVPLNRKLWALTAEIEKLQPKREV